MRTTPSTYDRIYVRTDKQCLFALDCGSTFYVDLDPLLPQTYISIHLNDRPIYFHDFVASRTLVECPIGMAIYNSHVEQIQNMNEESEFNDRCQTFVAYLYDLAGQMDVYNGKYIDQPLYIKGQDIVNIIEKAGYLNIYLCPLEDNLYMPFDREKLYFIPPHFVEDEILDLSPLGLDRIIEWNHPVDICNIFTIVARMTGSDRLYVIGSDIDKSFQEAGYDTDFGIEDNKKYYIPADLIVNGRVKSFTCDDISKLITYNASNREKVPF
ncbi:hypothetical protein [Chamaesiphon sp.]|uniref:hypothetical protein n=1 Tax=Chamaesiphon sp. TaxID=2814140 RepID=UPI0035948710